MTRHAFARLAMAVLTGLSAAVVPSWPDVASAETNGVLKPWSAQYMDQTAAATEAEAVAAAKSFDLLVAKTDSYSGLVPAMRAANPEVEVLAYVNATFANRRDRYLPESWYIHDFNGNRVQSVRYLSWLMNPAEPGWIATRIEDCRNKIATHGYTGCGLDLLGTAPVTPPFDGTGFVTGSPVNPATGAVWTFSEWLDATTKLAAQVRAAVAPALVYGNSLGNGTRYLAPTAPTSQLLDGLDGGLVEGFIRQGRAPAGALPTFDSWKSDLDMVIDAEAKGKKLCLVTKTWFETTDPTIKDNFHKLALATYLLGANGLTRFFFTYDQLSEPSITHPWWSTDLGAPTSAHRLRGDGSWVRNFERGKVLANPSQRPVEVNLQRRFTTLDGASVTTLTLPPYSGEVLVRTRNN